MNNYVIECQSVSKSFQDGKENLSILQGIDFRIEQGKQIAIMGRSGSGKTTLLQLLGGLDIPTDGEIYLAGENFKNLSEVERCIFRNRNIGFIYQFHHLLPEFNALENVAMPLLIAGTPTDEANKVAKELIDSVGLSNRITHRPAKLSGGERQRIAIARSLANDPKCVLADEPTGNLDEENAELAFSLMQRLNKDRGTTFIIVTHDQELADRVDQTYHLINGKLERG